MAKYVINTTNDNDTYSFFMPLSCMIWKKIIGYEPLAFFIGSESGWRSDEKRSFILAESEKFAQIHFVSPENKMKSSTVAQVSRLYAAALPHLDNDDYIIVSDIDTLPIKRSWFHVQEPDRDFHIWNRHVYDNQKRFAMCHLGGSVKIWREIMGIETLGINRALKAYLDRSRDNWRYDETLATEKILQWHGWPDKVQLIGRKWPDDKRPALSIYRGDGNDNKFPGTIERYVEAHAWRPGYKPFNWNNNLQLLNCLCSEEDVQYAKEYGDQYRRMKK